MSTIPRLASKVRIECELSPLALLHILGRVGQNLFAKARQQGRTGHVEMSHVGGRLYAVEWKDKTDVETNEVPNKGGGYGVSKETIGGEPIVITRACEDGTIDSMSVLRQVIEFRVRQLREIAAADDHSGAALADERAQELELLLQVIAGPVHS